VGKVLFGFCFLILGVFGGFVLRVFVGSFVGIDTVRITGASPPEAIQ
jgi:hypothetical protein